MSSAVPVTPVKGQWQKTFPVQINTDTLSIVFVKKLFAVAVSNVAYVRRLFPENAFFEKNLEGIRLKILKEEASCPGSCKVVFWLRGCFDAIEKRYLKKATLALYEDPQKPHEITESFSFGFRYGASGASMDMSSDSPSFVELADELLPSEKTEDVKLQTKNLLNTILNAGKFLGQLPKKMTLTMKLQYYESAPSDYLPKGFKTDDSPDFVFAAGPVNIKMGLIETGFHSVRMVAHTSSYLFIPPDEKSKASLTVKNGDSGTQKHTITSKNSNIAHTPRSSCQQTQPDMSDTNLEGEFEVSCPCGINEDCGVMILCDGCESWQHAVCFRIIDEADVPKSHLCRDCAKTKENMLDNGSVTDSTILDLSNEQVKSVCLFRRALFLCANNDMLSVCSISKQLGVNANVAKGLMNKLQNEGAVKDVRGRSGNKAVLKAHVEGVLLPRFFYMSNQPASPQHRREDGSLCTRVPTPPSSLERKHSGSDKRHQPSDLNELHMAAERLTLQKDPELQLLSQESADSPTPCKRRRICNVVNTPIPVTLR